MYDDLIKRLRDSEHEIDCSLCDRDCCYPDGKVHGKCIIIEAADAIEERDRHILTLQHEMMAEAESHTALVERLSKQNKKLEEVVKTAIDLIPCWIPVTERLPETIHEYVLCCDEKGGQFVGWIGEGRIVSGKARAFQNGGKGRYITHWMPLPEPPKEES